MTACTWAGGVIMSVLAVFGQNLRALCRRHSSQANVAQKLGIGRVQFQRYLNGESFPKPNLLKIICDFFDVDARILTEPLDDGLLLDMRRAAKAVGLAKTGAALAEAYSQFQVNPVAFETTDDFPDGQYLFWRRSMSRSELVARTVMLVRTLDHCRIVTGFDPRSMYPDHPHDGLTRLRKYKGILFRQRTGYSAILYHPEPSWAVSHIFLSPVPISGDGPALYGFTTLGRTEFPGMTRMSRVVWQKIGSTFAEKMAAARSADRIPPEAVPPQILMMITEPLA